MSTCAVVRSQIDTLNVGDRDPDYYYWDTNWWDYYYLNSDLGKQRDWRQGGAFIRGCKPEFARYCYVDTSLQVIGIAAALGLAVVKTDSALGVYGPGFDPGNDYFYNKMQPEYFRLYEVDSSGDSMHYMTQGQWTVKQQPRHYIQTAMHPNEPYPQGQKEYAKMFEVYFDNVVVVHDSFYVSVTANNLCIPIDLDDMFGAPTDGFAYSCLLGTYDQESYITSGFRPNPNHYKRKLRHFDSRNYDYNFGVTDTNWHTFHTTFYDTNSTPTGWEWSNFLCIFPIVDTSTPPVVAGCQRPDGLTLAYANNGVATLMWVPSGTDRWELSLCNDGCAPDGGAVTQWDNYVATLQDLDTAQWYTAWVRSVCDTDRVSEWSDSLRFYVPGNRNPDDPDDPEGVETTADRYSYLMPNPASGSVTVASSFRIAEVELFSLDGRSLLRSKVDAMSTTLNLDGLAAGTYIVRIATTAGTAYKKLVVK